jgi:hypothetical protein
MKVAKLFGKETFRNRRQITRENNRVVHIIDMPDGLTRMNDNVRSAKVSVWLDCSGGGAGGKTTSKASSESNLKCTMNMGEAGFRHSSRTFGMTCITEAMIPTMSSHSEAATTLRCIDRQVLTREEK